MTLPDIPLDEMLANTLACSSKVALDEADIGYVVETLLPLVRTYAQQEYDRGIESGHYFARQKVAHRLGLGEIKP